MDQRIYSYITKDETNPICYGETRHPFWELGSRETKDGKRRVCGFFPGACGLVLNRTDTNEKIEMAHVDESGFFGTIVDEKDWFDYTFTAYYPDGNTYTCQDTYNFDSTLPKEELELFKKGINYHIYNTLGAHRSVQRGVEGVMFAVWAPNALMVSVAGNFNLWNQRSHIMEANDEYGVFSLFVPGAKVGDIYKYAVTIPGGAVVLKSDPYGFSHEKRPDNASIVAEINYFKWSDKKYMDQRSQKDIYKSPMNIYEVHLGSWKKPTEEDGSFYNYRELADQLSEYMKDMNYTHIELLPVMEHPFDGSWGYQVTGYYAPSSRYGTPGDFRYFVETMHKNGIGVILDWVPAHFPKDAFGLAKFDGSCLYEHQDKRKGEHPDWGTLIFNTERPEVSNFLISNAFYWVEQYHIDGIRMDAVASMLYLNYGRKDGEWIPNKFGGRENLDTVEFLKHLNSMMAKTHPDVMMIAEESTAWPNVTGDVTDGKSLGFNMKWNMGWMNDFLKYMSQDPLFKKGVHGCLTFSMMYAYSERFVLVLSHDEVVHGKYSLINKMPGNYEEKFANLRLAYGFMTGHPGKKLLFMGQDFGQFAEWNEGKSLDWQLVTDYEMHRKMQDYCRDLNALYKKQPAFFEDDFDPYGFEWMSCMDADHSIVSFIRRARSTGKAYLCVCNFTPIVYSDFRQAVPVAGSYKEVLNSDQIKYGGYGYVNPRAIKSEAVPHDGKDNSIMMTLPPLGIVIFEFSFQDKTQKEDK